MKQQQFEEVNGFSNLFWHSDGEYDDMSNRLVVFSLNDFHIITIFSSFHTELRMLATKYCDIH